MPRSRSSITAAGRAVGARRDHEALGRRGHRVEVAHPHGALVGDRGRADSDERSTCSVGAAVLARAGLRDLAAEIARDELRAVTDAEQRNARVVDRGIDRRRAVDVHRRGTAREDDRLRLAREHLRDRHRPRHDLAVHVRLAHAPRDQLRVLRPEVDDENEIMLISLAHRPSLTRTQRDGRLRLTSSAHADALRPLERLALGLQRRARPSLRPSGIPSPSRSRWWPSRCAARRRG